MSAKKSSFLHPPLHVLKVCVQYDELCQGPGPDLGLRLNSYGDRTIMGTGHYGDRLISGPAIIRTRSLVACNDRNGPENDTPGPETRGAVPKMIPPVP